MLDNNIGFLEIRIFIWIKFRYWTLQWNN